MTALQKHIIGSLLNGYTLTGSRAYGYRLLSPDKHPSRRIHYKTYLAIRKLLRRRGGQILIDKNEVRKLHGRSWVKKVYNENYLFNKKVQPVNS